MTTIKNFVETYIGRAVDESGNFQGNYPCFRDGRTKGCHQCVSIIKFFCKKLYGTPNAWFGDAANGANADCNFLKWYEIIPANQVPKRWDLVIFERNASNFHYGHIGIVLYANRSEIYYLEQNAGNGDGYGLWNNAIRITKKWYSGILAFRRFSGIWNIVQKDEFDKLVFNGAPYIWEATNSLKRKDVAIHIEKNFNKTDFWKKERPDDSITRFELATMISRASKKDISQIYNGSNPNINATATEFTIMMSRGKN